MKQKNILFIIFALVLCQSSQADTFEQWLPEQQAHSLKFLKNNISPGGAKPGTVAASPSKAHPNYFYHWVRDASLVMLTVSRYLDKDVSAEEKQWAKNTLRSFASFSRANQQTHTIGGMGEPKFYLDGTAFFGTLGTPAK